MMSFLGLTPDAVTSAAQQWEAIGSALTEANSTAAGSTTGFAAMAADDVSAAVRSLFAQYGTAFQAASAQAAAFHSQLVSSLNGGVAAYLSTEVANAKLTLTNAANGAAAPVPASFSWGFGPFSVTMDSSVSSTGALIVTGSLAAAPGLALGVDAVGPPLSAANAFGQSMTAVANAARTGDPVGALIALLNTPANVGNGLLFGQGAFAAPVAPPPGFTSAGINVPYGGLLTPVQPASLTLTPSTGAPTVVPLAGPEFGGLLPAVQAVLHKPYFGLGLLVPAV